MARRRRIYGNIPNPRSQTSSSSLHPQLDGLRRDALQGYFFLYAVLFESKPPNISEMIPLSHILSASEYPSSIELPTDNKPHATALFGTCLIDSTSATDQC